MRIKARPLYRFTHIDNLPWLLDNGIVCSNSSIKYDKYHCIGDGQIIERRSQKLVPIAPGGTLSDYVPFYFAPRSPMLFVLSRQGKVMNSEVIYFVSTVEHVQQSSQQFVFTDGHALVEISRFYDDILDIGNIDWQVMRSQYWNDTPELQDRKRRREAEFLVYQHVPINLIKWIVTENKATAQKVTNALNEVNNEEIKVVVRPNFYY